MQLQPNDKSYWDNRYKTGETGWDIGTVSTPLKMYIDQCENKSAAILIPGCGNAHEAAYLLQQGFTNVTIIDISPAAIVKVRAVLRDFEGKQLHIICGDFFALNQTFDLILEQTFFCALPPATRQAYVTKMHELLKPGGKLVGVLFNRQFDQGPPFGGTSLEYQDLFSELFAIEVLEKCYNSIQPREGTEVFINFRKK